MNTYVLETEDKQALQGVIYGPDGNPLRNAVVHLPSLHRSTRTGKHGEFIFEIVSDPALEELCVEAGGREVRIDLTGLSAPWPLAIHFRL